MKFYGNIKNPVHTGVPIEGNGEPLRVAIVDVDTGEVVKCISAEVEVVVLGAEFAFRDDQEWSCQDFCSKIFYGKNGKSLLRGDRVVLPLKDGVCLVEYVCFKHMRDWFKKTKLRLGAKFVGDLDGTRIREAMTEPFFVKDRRAICKGDKPLLLTSNIWEIKGIGKKSTLAKKLIEKNIRTVKDFLVEYNLYHDRLKQMFEEHRNSHKFEAILEHVLSCQIDKNMYLYSSTTLQQTCGLSNTVGKLTRMMHKEDQYMSVEEISEADKLYIPRTKRQLAGHSSKSSCSCDESESSCSYAVKKQRTTTSTLGDANAERAVMDYWATDIASSDYVPTFSSDIDNLHNQPLFSPSRDDILLWGEN
ncbi:hypothetical protein Leryth_013043 [Lithospermum erythrorhizon]|uniref:Calmodulin-binding protein n=1 Tax=Lithospermum erythrorhizon TaxID=34254 RepID=A0AAV3RPA6_LITER|nr:hypothetical protein Leryth_013043 [Lithospermum erythrorhizon]